MDQEQISPFKNFEIPPFFRRKLLPLWIKVFCWIFIVMGVAAVFALAAGLLGNSPGLEFYGLSTDQPLSIAGLSVTAILLFKGFTAYSLWFEKDNAIKLAKIDAASGIIICIAMMVIQPIISKENISLRLEIIFLIFYYMKISKIEYEWYNKQY